MRFQSPRYELDVVYHQTPLKKPLWKSGLEPEAVGALLVHYGWQECQQVGRAEYEERYLRPLKREMAVMEVERAVHAQRMAHQGRISKRRRIYHTGSGDQEYTWPPGSYHDRTHTG